MVRSKKKANCIQLCCFLSNITHSTWLNILIKTGSTPGSRPGRRGTRTASPGTWSAGWRRFGLCLLWEVRRPFIPNISVAKTPCQTNELYFSVLSFEIEEWGQWLPQTVFVKWAKVREPLNYVLFSIEGIHDSTLSHVAESFVPFLT